MQPTIKRVATLCVFSSHCYSKEDLGKETATVRCKGPRNRFCLCPFTPKDRLACSLAGPSRGQIKPPCWLKQDHRPPTLRVGTVSKNLKDTARYFEFCLLECFSLIIELVSLGISAPAPLLFH